MISQEYTSTLFNSIAFHEPLHLFDRVPSEDYGLLHSSQPIPVPKDMFTQTQDSYSDSFPPHYPAFRRMSADTQASSADSASPDHKPIANDKMASLVLPPIHDLPRPLSPQTSDASSTRSPQWQQQQPQQPQHHQQQPQQHYAHPGPQYNFPPLDQHSRRPQLHINPNPPDHRAQPNTASYPTPTTANGYNSSSGGSNTGGYSSTYAPYAVRRPEEHYRQVPPPPPGPPIVTPATLAAAVGTQQRRRGKLPKPVTEFLKKWLLAHTDHPYPTEDEKKWLCSETGLSMSQVSNWMINARRRILAPAAKANAAAAAAASANAAVTSSATATAATPYYSRSPPVRTVSGSTSSSDYTNGGSHYSAPRRDSSYAPYPMPASRVTNTHQPQQQQHQYSSPATNYPSSAPPYSAASAYHFQSPTPVPAGHGQGPTSAPPLPPALAPYASSTLAPFGDSHEPNHGTERTKSPGADFAYAPQ